MSERGDRFLARKECAVKWITREHVKVDRVACPWLIRKFVDPEAEFLFVPGDQVRVGERCRRACD